MTSGMQSELLRPPEPGQQTAHGSRRPRLGFLGVGWIGRHRMRSIAESRWAEVRAVSDPDPDALRQAAVIAPAVETAAGLQSLLNIGLDGLVIATPSALHAEHAIRALERGLAVFCQKPLGRNRAETCAVVAAACRADRLLAVDLSYRGLAGACRARELILSGAIGEVFAADLVFHNAYGPDKGWYYEPSQSGGGCVMDLGVHLVDLLLWILDFPAVTAVSSRLFAKGKRLAANSGIEDFAMARLELESGACANLSCSWRLAAGRDAVISATFYGTRGGLCLQNENGSFYDFRTEWFKGTSRELLAVEDGSWWGRMAVAWARRLACNNRYDPEAGQQEILTGILDRIYGRDQGAEGSRGQAI